MPTSKKPKPLRLAYYAPLESSKQPDPLGNILKKALPESSAPGLGNLLHPIRHNQDLSALINKVLPEEMHDHCWVARFEAGLLMLATDHGAFAMKLRFMAPELLAFLRKQPGFANIYQIDIKIEPNLPGRLMALSLPAAPCPQIPKKISPHAQKTLEEAASYIKHPGLCQALLRLSKAKSR